MAATHPGPLPIRAPHPFLAGRTGTLDAWRSLSARRRLQLVLGFVWLVDAALQYQPYMFGRDFVTQTIEPTAAGAPWIVARPTLWASHFMVHHITAYNSVFATIQLLIAVLLFYRPTVKLGLAVSMVWGLGIWWLAEGIGGIFDNASPLTGAPGGVILYVIVAALVWPRRNAEGARGDNGGDDRGDDGGGRSVAEQGVAWRVVADVVWTVLWLGLAALSLEQANRSPSAIHDTITGAESGEPSWIKSIESHLAVPFAHHGTEASIVLAVLFAVVAVGIYSGATLRLALVLAGALGLAIWVVEAFGGIATGSATDVNSGPLLVLLAACYWPLRAGRRLRPAAGGRT